MCKLIMYMLSLITTEYLVGVILTMFGKGPTAEFSLQGQKIACRLSNVIPLM